MTGFKLSGAPISELIDIAVKHGFFKSEEDCYHDMIYNFISGVESDWITLNHDGTETEYNNDLRRLRAEEIVVEEL